MASFEEEVQEALKILKEQEFEGEVQRATKLLKEQQFEEEVQRAMQILREQEKQQAANQQPERPFNAGESIARLPRGMLQFLGSLADLGYDVSKKFDTNLKESSLYRGLEEDINRVGKPPNSLDTARKFDPWSDNRRMGEELPKVVDKLYGKDLMPRTSREKFEQDTGAFLTPMGPLGVVAKGAKPLVKGAMELGKKMLGATGASAAVNFTPRINEEGTIGGAVEDIGKATLGQGLPGLAKGIYKAGIGTGKAIRHPIRAVEDVFTKGLSKFVNPNEEVHALAQKHNVDLPFNVGAGSDVLDSVANNYLKSMFTSRKYRKAIEHSDRSMIDAVRGSIEEIAEGNIVPGDASALIREQLKSERRVLQKESKKLYDTARENIGEDRVVAKNAKDYFESDSFNRLINNPILNKESKDVVKKLLEIRDNVLGGASSNAEAIIRKNNPGVSESFIQQSLKRAGIGKQANQAVPVKDLIDLRKYLLNAVDYNTEVYGIESFLSGLANQVHKDIKSMPNKEALQHYLGANEFYRTNIGDRFKNSIAESLINGTKPTEAYNLMGSSQNIEILKKIIGKDPVSVSLFNDLRKAKAREIFGKAVEGDLYAEGTIRTGPFSRIFQGTEKRNEYLELLLGKPQYDNLKELAKISGSFSQHGRNLLNTSSTAHVASDFKISKRLFDVTVGNLSYILSGAAGYNISGASYMGAVAGAAAPALLKNATSRLLANERVVKKSLEYARARKAGREKTASNILNKQLIPIAITEVSKVRDEPEQELPIQEPLYEPEE